MNQLSSIKWTQLAIGIKVQFKRINLNNSLSVGIVLKVLRINWNVINWFMLSDFLIYYLLTFHLWLRYSICLNIFDNISEIIINSQNVIVRHNKMSFDKLFSLNYYTYPLYYIIIYRVENALYFIRIVKHL